MGILSKFFGKKKTETESHIKAIDSKPHSEEGARLGQLGLRMEDLLNQDRYIARSDYFFLAQESDLLGYFETLEKSGMLNAYCVKNHLSAEVFRKTIADLKDINALVDQHNEVFIRNKMVSEKTYLDGILNVVDPAINLDDDQRRVILTDEDHCLVIAGAGA